MTISTYLPKLNAEQKFMLSVLVVNAGNYVYNLAIGRILGPELFADAALLITLLLSISFIAMTFQLTTTKFSVLFDKSDFDNFISLCYRFAAISGVIFGAIIIVFAKELQELFSTQSHFMFTVFGFGIPIYFIMSVNRGKYQGSNNFKALAKTYQSEMISRLVITLILLFTLSFHSSILVAIGIILSFVFGLIPFKIKIHSIFKKNVLAIEKTKHVLRFFMLTAFYELSQIIINNSDILLVKHYFNEYEAGLYASLALIGRLLYFIAWMFVMLLLPKVVQKQKENKEHHTILFKYVGYISILSITTVIGCYMFPTTVINLMFGSEYLPIAPLLWKYAVATSLFAISNIFAYYYLSLEKYIPVYISGLIGILQVSCIIFFHNSLQQVVLMQIIAMSILLMIQLIYFYTQKKA